MSLPMDGTSLLEFKQHNESEYHWGPAAVALDAPETRLAELEGFSELDTPADYSEPRDTSPWDQSSLLALQDQCDAHSVLERVVVVREGDTCRMTTIREQLEAISTAQASIDLTGVRDELDAYISRLRSYFHRAMGDSEDHGLLYYPFGGVDSISGLAGPGRCAVLTSAEEFGCSAQNTAHDLHQMLNSDNRYLLKGAGGPMFMSHDAFEELHNELGLRGVGALALIRLLAAGSLVVSLAFFSLDHSGNVNFANQEACHAGQGTSPYEHAVVTVETAEGALGQLWFIHPNTREEDVAVDAFCRRLHPATLLIKAAPDSLWVCPEQEAPADDHLAYARCIKRALQPAHSHLGCGVVSDSCQVDAETLQKSSESHLSRRVGVQMAARTTLAMAVSYFSRKEITLPG